ncbi:phosphotransferase [Nocardioides marmoriginsengisoli]|uniref:Phosphotransferase n=1 Tax=Nocardioides marmoriginsengisoli TaxID=661483 RepID=A0A3N0CSE3_9ACTN|nr:phosphotransferase [Nocardioides marmoriginsengisoli]RNL65823.1 phosphotransferase [Nocardioides marmoriginsengisoli]
MWQPDPAWRALGRAAGPTTAGIWRARVEGTDVVVKRLRRPLPDEESFLSDRTHAAYWRREAEVALDPGVVDGPGLVPARVLRLEEDDEGCTLMTEEVVAEPPPALFVARALGRFAAGPYADVPWAARRTLVDRLALAEARGGWPTLARTTIADTAAFLWSSRRQWLAAAAAAPAGRLHGDAVPGNVVASRGEDAVAIDWQGFGIGPVGTDLGYYALSVREDFEVLLSTYLDGVVSSSGAVDADAVRTAAVVMCVYTAFTRAEWALSRIAPGEGALAGKFNHPSVAPHLRALQRQAPQVESLLR